LRILIDTVATTVGGGGRSRARELAATFPALAPHHEYLFVATEPVARSIREVAPETRVVSPPRAFGAVPARIAWEHLLLPRLATRSFAPELVFSPFNVAPTRWPSPSPRIAAIVSNLAPYAEPVRQLYRGRERARLEALRRLTDRTISRASRVFVLSEQAFALIDEKLLDGKAELISMAPPPRPDLSTHRLESEHGAPYFLIAGDLLRFKGIEMALRALGRLAPTDRPRLVVAGRPLDRPYVKKLQSTARALGVEQDVDFVGSLRHDDLLTRMARARGCVIPSRFENASRVPVEAMSLGIPVIVSEIPSFREACGDAALYFDLDDPDGLADHIRSIKCDASLRSERTRAGYERLTTLDATSASEQILSSIERLDNG
jgi:glycosyltransferase involved in cell wall biosynthesis